VNLSRDPILLEYSSHICYYVKKSTSYRVDRVGKTTTHVSVMLPVAVCTLFTRLLCLDKPRYIWVWTHGSITFFTPQMNTKKQKLNKTIIDNGSEKAH